MVGPRRRVARAKSARARRQGPPARMGAASRLLVPSTSFGDRSAVFLLSSLNYILPPPLFSSLGKVLAPRAKGRASPSPPLPPAAPAQLQMCDDCDNGGACGICLVAANASDCSAAPSPWSSHYGRPANDASTRLPPCTADLVAAGGLCAAGRTPRASCGTVVTLNNCGAYDVYQRLDCTLSPSPPAPPPPFLPDPAPPSLPAPARPPPSL